jgi:hypothetical protein
MFGPTYMNAQIYDIYLTITVKNNPFFLPDVKRYYLVVGICTPSENSVIIAGISTDN